jgi:hypothetical protein
MHSRIAIYALFLVWPGAAMGQTAPATTNTILESIDGGTLHKGNIDVGTLKCAALENGRRSCLGNIDGPGFGISVMLKTETDGNRINTLTLFMASPDMAGDKAKGAIMTTVFLVCVARAVAALQPDVPQAKREKMLETMGKRMGRKNSEVKLEDWRYSMGKALFVSFSAERGH